MRSIAQQRLFNGAKVLGNFWRAGEKCLQGWKSTECECVPKSKFCKAKMQWIELALKDGRMIEEGEFGLALMMTASEWDETGLTLNVEMPDVGKIGIGGPKGSISMQNLLKVTPETLPSIMRIFKFFPDSQVIDTVFADPKAKPLDAPE